MNQIGIIKIVTLLTIMVPYNAITSFAQDITYNIIAE